jgi:hypothetical protein
MGNSSAVGLAHGNFPQCHPKVNDSRPEKGAVKLEILPADSPAIVSESSNDANSRGVRYIGVEIAEIRANNQSKARQI